MCVCVLGSTGEKEEEGGGGVGSSYLFVLPSRRVREQIKGFSFWGERGGGTGGT